MFFGDALARVYHLSDAAHDRRALLGHSFVADLGIRFRAAAPLRNKEDFNLEKLCESCTPNLAGQKGGGNLRAQFVWIVKRSVPNL
jgi:hypothetical protein